MLKDMSYEELMSKTRVLDDYDVLINEDDEVMLGLPVRIPGKAEEAMFYYSGGDHGFLIKNHRTVVLCGYLHKATHDTIYQNDMVLIVEIDGVDSVTEVNDYPEAILEEFEAQIVKMDGIDELAERIMKDKEKED